MLFERVTTPVVYGCWDNMGCCNTSFLGFPLSMEEEAGLLSEVACDGLVSCPLVDTRFRGFFK